MLVDRITSALTFKREVYADVEKDTSFTRTAFLIVAVVAVINAMGSAVGREGGFVGWLISVLFTAVFAVGGFALGAWVMAWLAQTMFKAQTSFEEIVRTVGLAYVWNAVGFLGILGAITPALFCITGPISFVAMILGVAASLIALKEALDLEWGPTIVVVLVGWLVIFVASILAGTVLGLLGFGAAALTGNL